jgi:hypothetical protein
MLHQSSFPSRAMRTVPTPILQAIVAGDHAGLQHALGSRIRPFVSAEPPDVCRSLEKRFAVALSQAFGDELKKENRRAAWIEFERNLLLETRCQLLEVLGKLSQENQRNWRAVIDRMEGLAHDPEVLEHLRKTTIETLGVLGRVEASGQALQTALQHAAVESKPQFAALERAINRRALHEDYAGGETASLLKSLIAEYTQLFVERDEALGQLKGFVDDSGVQFFLVRAPAGQARPHYLQIGWQGGNKRANSPYSIHSASSASGAKPPAP